MPSLPTLSPHRTALIALAMIAAMAAALLAMGRVPICTCGTIKLWHGVAQSAENSQHIADWYTLSHVLHGFLFYLLAWLLLPRASVAARLLVAVLVESSWEVLENTPTVIERYRAATISLQYYGDSIVNSISDVMAMTLGFLLAARLSVWAIVPAAFALEALMFYAIRDNLALNILMLIYPLDIVRAWQAAP
jgi:hypothetical protein